jgi:hypothetical protein
MLPGLKPSLGERDPRHLQPMTLGRRCNMQFTRVVGPVEDLEIWSARSDGFSFVISYESRGGPGFHGRRTGFVASWRPIHPSSRAIKVGGSPFERLAEAEEACKAMLGHLKRRRRWLIPGRFSEGLLLRRLKKTKRSKTDAA